MAIPAFITALKKEITDRLVTYEADRANNLSFVGGGWISNPIEFVKRSTETYGAFLVVARDYKADLRPPVMAIPAASAMQTLFTRFALLWQSLPAPAGTDPLNKKLLDAIDEEVPKFVGLLT